MATNIKNIKTGKTITNLGSKSGAASHTFSVASLGSTVYSKLTASNFIVGFSNTPYVDTVSGSVTSGDACYEGMAPSVSYNSSNGVLTVSGCSTRVVLRNSSGSGVKANNVYATVFAYVMY